MQENAGNQQINALQGLFQQIGSQVGQQVYGQQLLVEQLLGAFLIGGHVLLEGPPGVAKTLLARTFAQVLGLSVRRIQFTPDLMPSDITGVNVFDQQSGSFRFVPGPLLSDIVLADEINRTPPKTQAALLEAMEERAFTIDGERHGLSELFFVMATQNPIEHEGTFPLPEAQLDRFLFKLRISYPAADSEREIIARYSGSGAEQPPESRPPALSPPQLLGARRLLRQVRLSSAVADYIVRLLTASREHPNLILGASSRAGVHLALAAKVEAVRAGRAYVIPDDVQAMAVPVLAHRLIFGPEMFEASQQPETLVTEICGRVPVPERKID